MSNSPDIQDRIDAYLTGKLQGKELVDFEKSISENPVLKHDIQKAKAVQNLVIQHRLLDVKALAKQEEAKLKNGNKTLLKGLIGGLVGLSILGAGLVYFQEEEKKSTTTTPIEQLIEKEKPSIEISKEKPINTEKEAIQAAPEETKINVLLEEKIKKQDSSTIPVQTEVNDSDTTSAQKITESKTKDVASKAVNTSSATKKQIDPCETQKITANLQTLPTCTNKHQGEIIVTGIAGGEKPYQQQLKNSSGDELFSYTELKAGTYFLTIIDNKGCTTDFTTKILEKSCPIDDHFNPSIGQVWEIPTSEENGKITIYTRSGTPVYEKQLLAKEISTWDGAGNSGSLPAAYYIFVIEYNNGSRTKGSITISK